MLSPGLKLDVQFKDDATSSVTTVIDNLQHLLNETSIMENRPTNNNNNNHIPFIYSDKLVEHNFLDRFKDDFQQLFAFDDEACCGQLPESDEYVFHFRNFKSELTDAHC